MIFAIDDCRFLKHLFIFVACSILIFTCMANIRKKALDEFVTRDVERFYVENRPVSEFFGQNVFDLDKILG